MTKELDELERKLDQAFQELKVKEVLEAKKKKELANRERLLFEKEKEKLSSTVSTLTTALSKEKEEKLKLESNVKKLSTIQANSKYNSKFKYVATMVFVPFLALGVGLGLYFNRDKQLPVKDNIPLVQTLKQDEIIKPQIKYVEKDSSAVVNEPETSSLLDEKLVLDELVKTVEPSIVSLDNVYQPKVDPKSYNFDKTVKKTSGKKYTPAVKKEVKVVEKKKEKKKKSVPEKVTKSKKRNVIVNNSATVCVNGNCRPYSDQVSKETGVVIINPVYVNGVLVKNGGTIDSKTVEEPEKEKKPKKRIKPKSSKSNAMKYSVHDFNNDCTNGDCREKNEGIEQTFEFAGNATFHFNDKVYHSENGLYVRRGKVYDMKTRKVLEPVNSKVVISSKAKKAAQELLDRKSACEKVFESEYFIQTCVNSNKSLEILTACGVVTNDELYTSTCIEDAKSSKIVYACGKSIGYGKNLKSNRFVNRCIESNRDIKIIEACNKVTTFSSYRLFCIEKARSVDLIYVCDKEIAHDQYIGECASYNVDSDVIKKCAKDNPGYNGIFSRLACIKEKSKK